jgi:hypothetical protein
MIDQRFGPSQTAYDHLMCDGHRSMTNFFIVTSQNISCSDFYHNWGIANKFFEGVPTLQFF